MPALWPMPKCASEQNTPIPTSAQEKSRPFSRVSEQSLISASDTSRRRWTTHTHGSYSADRAVECRTSQQSHIQTSQRGSALCPSRRPLPIDGGFRAVYTSVVLPPTGQDSLGGPGGPRKVAAWQALAEAALFAVGAEPESGVDCGDGDWFGFGGRGGGWPDWGNSTAARPLRWASLRAAAQRRRRQDAGVSRVSCSP
jgi:hypothetical protein